MIDTEPRHLAMVQAILHRHLPPGSQVWAYGSRARRQRVWRGSDLDLLIRAEKPLDWGLLGRLEEDFSESLLPYMVDLHDWHETSPDFLERIGPDLVHLPMTADVVSD